VILIVVVVGIEKFGNFGVIVCSVDVVGVDGIFVVDVEVDFWNLNVICVLIGFVFMFLIVEVMCDDVVSFL